MEPTYHETELKFMNARNLEQIRQECRLDFLACADLHLTSRRPPCRTEADIRVPLRQKLFQLWWLHNALGIPVICAGDVFDVATSDKQTEHLAFQLFDALEPPQWLVLPGNHDMPQHNGTLISSGSYSLLGYLSAERLSTACLNLTDDVWDVCDDYRKYPKCNVALLPFGFPCKDVRAGIIAHHILTWPGNEREPFPGASDEGVSAQQLLDDNPAARIIVTGDNHASFIHRDIHDPSRVLINPGSLWRRRKDQWDHRPSVYGFQVETGNVVRFLLDVQPADAVMRPDSDVQTAKAKKKSDSDAPLIVADRIDAGTTFKGLMSALEQDAAKDYDYPQRLRSAATRMGDDNESKHAKELLLEEVEKL